MRARHNSELPAGFSIIRHSSNDFRVYFQNKPTGLAAGTREEAVGAAWVESKLMQRSGAAAPDRTFSAMGRQAAAAPVAAARPKADYRNFPATTRADLTALAAKRPVAAGKRAVTFAQAKSLGASMGGMNNYIQQSFSDAVQKSYDNLSHQDILTHLGIDSELASRILDAMERAGVRESTYPQADPRKFVAARGIFEEMSGVTTPMMKPNPFYVTPKGTAQHVDEATFAAHRASQTIPRMIEREGVIEQHASCPPGYSIQEGAGGKYHVYFEGRDTGKYGLDYRKACEIASRMSAGVVQKRAPRAADAARKNPQTAGGSSRKFALEGEITYPQAKIIGLSVGGLSEYIHGSIASQIGSHTYAKGLSHLDALKHLGLTSKAAASRVISALDEKGLKVVFPPGQMDRMKIILAREVLETVGGIAAPMGYRPNPHSRKNSSVLPRSVPNSDFDYWRIREGETMSSPIRHADLVKALADDPTAKFWYEDEFNQGGLGRNEFTADRQKLVGFWIRRIGDHNGSWVSEARFADFVPEAAYWECWWPGAEGWTPMLEVARVMARKNCW